MIQELSHKLTTKLASVQAEEGQALTEYAVILVLVSTVTVGALNAIGLQVDELLGQVVDAFG